MIPLKLLALESEVKTQLLQAHGTEGEWLLVSFLKMTGAVHQALVGLAVADRQHMRKLMACRLDSSILDLFRNDFIKVPFGLHALLFLGELRVMAGIALDADAPTLLGHAEHEGPPIFRIQVCIRQHEQTLVLPQLNILLEVFKYLPSVKLLDLGVVPHPRLDNSFLFKDGQALLYYLRV